MRRAVFLDRDGTINVEKDYLYRIEDFEFIPGAAEAVSRLNQAGFLVIVVSNQSGVARGYYTEEDVDILHRHISQELLKSHAHIDLWLYCPHHPAGKGSYALPCNCRKPLPGMLKDAANRFGVDLADSIMIGDKQVDIEAAVAAGCTPILVRTGYGTVHEKKISPDVLVFDDLKAAAESVVTGLMKN